MALGLSARIAVVPGLEVFVAGEHTLGDNLAAEDDARVGLAIEFPNEDGDEGGRDEEDPEDPAPAGTLGEEAAADGTEDRPEEWAKSVDGGGSATLFSGEEIADDAAADGQTARATDAGKETKDDEGLDIRSEGTTNLPDGEEGV